MSELDRRLTKEEFQEIMSFPEGRQWVEKLFNERDDRLAELHNAMRGVRPYCYVGGWEVAWVLAHMDLFDLCVAREYARHTKQWKISDELRQRIWDEGINLEDNKGYTSWAIWPFDLIWESKKEEKMSHKALLVIDMINDFIHGDGTLNLGEKGQKIVPFIRCACEDMLKEGGLVWFCSDEHKPDEEQFTTGQWPVHAIIGSWGQELYGSLNDFYKAKRPGVYYQPKSFYNAFAHTDLAQRLRDHGISEVHLVGVCTDICVFATAMGAFENGFKVVVHKGGTATFTQNHQTFLDHMAFCFKAELV